MDTHPTFRTIILSVFSTLIAVLLVGAWLFTANTGLSQETAPDGPDTNVQPAEATTAFSGDGEKAAGAPLLPSSLGGDGGPTAGLPPQSARELGPDMPDQPDLVFSYYRLLGTAFNPRTSATTFAYNSNGCVYITAGTDNRFMAPLLLPDGAVLKFLRFYFLDSNTSTNLTAWITRYQPGTLTQDLTVVSSSGSSTVVGSSLSPEITHTVDTANWAYTLIIAPNGNAATNSFCGIRVAYYAPFFGATALPVILK